jgi:hypothetical protein
MAPSDTVIDAYWQTPPMARYFASITFVVSVCGHFGLLPLWWFVHHPPFLWQIPPQIWRLVTTYFITDGGLGILFDTYFLYRYMTELEVGNPRFPRKEDLLWYLIFVGGTILVSLLGRDDCGLASRVTTCVTTPQNICPDSVSVSTAITVPGIEEDYPYTSDSPLIRKIGLLRGVGMVGCLMDGSCGFYSLEWFFQLPTFLLQLIYFFFPASVCDLAASSRARLTSTAGDQLPC